MRVFVKFQAVPTQRESAVPAPLLPPHSNRKREREKGGGGLIASLNIRL